MSRRIGVGVAGASGSAPALEVFDPGERMTRWGEAVNPHTLRERA